MNLLEGKVALITGSSRGIGLAIATRFAAEGARVILSASRLGVHGKLPGTLEQAVADLQASGADAVAEVANLADSQSRSDLVERAESHFGPLDILVNNAAMARMGMPSQLTTADRNLMFEVNVNAPVELAQQVIPGMRERGQGWILNISSATSNQPQVPYPDRPEAAHVIGAYGASKAALDRYTEALAHEMTAAGLCINTLAPEAIVLTPGAEYVRDIAERRPDMVEPLEVMVEAALELCTQRHCGQVCFSRRLLHALQRPVMSLDGQTVLGDGLLAAQLD
ncbi:SDR family NAD(P)-dependent oxidoreductase [Halieaceae bacterium IMCC14734]|uniref:SDR family NAD(P)-dependent oxidoreductase n=1 Tax=Candidatus Litorirhabdus singularis TaxID=2518993 RepID=A0ABT3TIW4_9GAMM|nr:SDR family oxidoreductase [Candidatus Litorirhabdus singularis]MCX2982252.1 SDR family NAD(P)-dependent oxidoreductase [Candidatus Litorirhabdus singularis]